MPDLKFRINDVVMFTGRFARALHEKRFKVLQSTGAFGRFLIRKNIKFGGVGAAKQVSQPGMNPFWHVNQDRGIRWVLFETSPGARTVQIFWKIFKRKRPKFKKPGRRTRITSRKTVPDLVLTGGRATAHIENNLTGQSSTEPIFYRPRPAHELAKPRIESFFVRELEKHPLR